MAGKAPWPRGKTSQARLMGTVSFLLPKSTKPDDTRELGRACMAGGPDNMPWPTEVHVDPSRLTLRRTVDESGYLVDRQLHFLHRVADDLEHNVFEARNIVLQITVHAVLVFGVDTICPHQFRDPR